MHKKILRIALCLLLILVFPVTAFAQSETDTKTITIENTAEFLAFAENCRLDSYSRNLEVILQGDIDLSGTDFQGVPIFSGSFDGNGYTVSGLEIQSKGVNLGLFRYLTETAVVRDLTVTGSVQPQGTRAVVGGIAGSNAGRIENCSFSGTVSGSDRIGGIVGMNSVTGILENCRVEGSVHGDHFVGGIVGENQGVIRSCVNSGQVNTTVQQNSVEISDITLETLTGSENVSTVTDIGGIAGSSSGVIRDCQNRADIGYKHIGYNIGGIAGSQMGYLTNCENYGAISGRKEVGGIVGQMEPAVKLIYSEDVLQILQGQLDTMGSLTERASANAQYGAGSISSQIAAIQKEAQNASDAIGTLIPGREDPQPPDADTVLAAQNALSGSMSSIQGSMSSISATAQNTAGALASDLQAISDQIKTMTDTINSASENLGGSITDVSDGDTAEDMTGKVELCKNSGQILADRNAGGICGAIAMENDLDPDEDVELLGELSLNFESELRAVILNCRNEASVTLKKQNAGGIVGWMSMGLVRDSTNTGKLDGGTVADYVGGIAGRSSGFIRVCYTKCELAGGRFVGGVAGSGETVSDCRSMVKLNGAERTGAVLGFAESREEIRENFYLPVNGDGGAIDGISYDGCAQSLYLFDFLSLQGLPELFQSITLQFRFEDGTVQEISVPTGRGLPKEMIPVLPEKAGHAAHWDGFTGLYYDFDQVFTAVYTKHATVLESAQQRDGLPVLLAEGAFGAGAVIAPVEAAQTPALESNQQLVEAFGVSLPAEASEVTVRYLLPAQAAGKTLILLHMTEDGSWQQLTATVDGSYLVFNLPGGVRTLALLQQKSNIRLWVALGTACAVVVMTVTVIARHVRKKKQAKK